MRPFALLTLLMMVTIPLAGCMGLGGGDYEPRTHEFELVVNAPTSDTVSLYTLNDGVSQMNVVAMGFQTPDQEQLEVPNPTIRVKEGDTVILTVRNDNPLPHTFHLHGGLVDWAMDGVPFLNQMPIHQGESYTYIFKDMKAGSYFYHCHVDVAHHMDLGMYGAFIVEEVEPEVEFDREYTMMLDEWDNCHVHGNTDPVTGSEQTGEFSNRADCVERFLQDNLAQNQAANAARSPLCDGLAEGQPGYEELNCGGHSSTPPQQNERTWYPMTFPVYDPIYNTFLINGKAFPDTTPLPVKEGEMVKIRLMNVGEELHSMHLHGHTYTVTHKDGYPLPMPYQADTLAIAPGERYDVLVDMNNPGYWAFHDHIGLNVMNDDASPGGMFTCLAYDDFHGRDAFAYERAIECIDNAIEILAEGGGHTEH